MSITPYQRQPEPSSKLQAFLVSGKFNLFLDDPIKNLNRCFETIKTSLHDQFKENFNEMFKPHLQEEKNAQECSQDNNENYDKIIIITKIEQIDEEIQKLIKSWDKKSTLTVQAILKKDIGILNDHYLNFTLYKKDENVYYQLGAIALLIFSIVGLLSSNSGTSSNTISNVTNYLDATRNYPTDYVSLPKYSDLQNQVISLLDNSTRNSMFTPYINHGTDFNKNLFLHEKKLLSDYNSLAQLQFNINLKKNNEIFINLQKTNLENANLQLSKKIEAKVQKNLDQQNITDLKLIYNDSETLTLNDNISTDELTKENPDRENMETIKSKIKSNKELLELISTQIQENQAELLSLEEEKKIVTVKVRQSLEEKSYAQTLLLQ